MTRAEIGQLLSDQVTSLVGRKEPAIEPEVFDDAEGIGFDPLSRWGDRVYRPLADRWRE